MFRLLMESTVSTTKLDYSSLADVRPLRYRSSSVITIKVVTSSYAETPHYRKMTRIIVQSIRSAEETTPGIASGMLFTLRYQSFFRDSWHMAILIEFELTPGSLKYFVWGNVMVCLRTQLHPTLFGITFRQFLYSLLHLSPLYCHLSFPFGLAVSECCAAHDSKILLFFNGWWRPPSNWMSLDSPIPHHCSLPIFDKYRPAHRVLTLIHYPCHRSTYRAF